MATTTSAVKGNAPRRNRTNSLGGLIYAMAQLQEAMHILDQIHRRVDTELSKHLIVMDSLLSHSVPEKRRNLSCILMLYKDEEPARLSDLFRVTQDISS